ncbi:MAG: SH3 domain-containing protein, partial [Bacteroidota bacterium]
MKTLFSTLLLLLFACTCGRAQLTADVDLSRNRVIAVGGLKLRSAPNTRGETLARVPFNATVTILAACDAGIQSIGKHQGRPITGRWVRAAYDGQTGYLFDPYLYYQPTGLKRKGAEPYALIKVDEGVLDVTPGRFNWYGVYGFGNSRELKKVRRSYLVIEDQYAVRLLPTVAGEEQPNYLIGTKKAFAEHAFAGFGFDEPLANPCQSLKPWPDTLQQLLSVKCEATGDSLMAVSTQYLRWKNKTQDFFFLNGTQTTILALGDLDGDGSPDIITRQEGEVAYLQLHLSSPAIGNRLVEAVALQSLGKHP